MDVAASEGFERCVRRIRASLKSIKASVPAERGPILGVQSLWADLGEMAQSVTDVGQMLTFAALEKKARKATIEDEASSRRTKIRIAFIGAGTMHPLVDFVVAFLSVAGHDATIFVGDYDNAVSEVLTQHSALYAFSPDVVVFFPSPIQRPAKMPLTAPAESFSDFAKTQAQSVVALTQRIVDGCGATCLVANLALPGWHDLGAYRGRTGGSSWSLTKSFNLALGFSMPKDAQILDVEFLSTQHGADRAHSLRHWYESKQLYAPDFQVLVAREIAQLVAGRTEPPKKVLVTDLDNTLWGGVIGDDGVEGIELGDTSPRGEAYKAVQQYLKTLTERGVLLAVSSKNEDNIATGAFKTHPDMVLKLEDFVAFRANWDSKADNIREIATTLNLGLDSFVFLDDNPAELEIVRQFLPQVATLRASLDPAETLEMLRNCAFFDPRHITAEDATRTHLYHQESSRRALQSIASDMNAYLASLEMEATIAPFCDVDVPRIAQLINKSNQFNLTTIRRNEAQVAALIKDPSHLGFSVRLRDRFGDHGLIAVVVLAFDGSTTSVPSIEVETWLMSCRVLNRQVEDEVVNHIAAVGRQRGAGQVIGTYRPTERNALVAQLYPKMGFVCESLRDEPQPVSSESVERYRLDLAGFVPRTTHIHVEQR